VKKIARIKQVAAQNGGKQDKMLCAAPL